jgi:alpha-glucosidase (family GH31 glycosyl hydrolase)
MNYVGEKPVDPITFGIYPDSNGAASTTLYEDDGISPAYKQERFRRTNINVGRAAAGYTVSLSSPAGSYDPGPRKFNFVIKGEGRVPRVLTVADDGTSRKLPIR